MLTTTKDETAQVPAAIDFAADAGQGLELADSKSFAIPFLQILQGQSPQLETVDGARPGMFINTVTNELAKEVEVVPCFFKREYIRWAPRAQGGGFRGSLDAKAVDMKQVPGVTEYQGQLFMDVPEGVVPVDDQGKAKYDALSDTRNHFVLVKNAAGSWQGALLSLKSTQIKKSKRWLSIMKGIEITDKEGHVKTPATYSHHYLLTVAKEENAEGSWWGIEAKLIGPITNPPLYQAAKAFHDSIAAGLVETAPPVEQ